MKNNLAIISGGMDSITLLYEYKNSISKAISFNYKQKHHKEFQYAQENCEKLSIPWMLVDIRNIGDLLKSNLLIKGGDIPNGHYEDEVMRQTVVPFRNGIMLSIAAGIAASNSLEGIYIGVHKGDHAIYPDCRINFLSSIEKAMYYGTYELINLHAPYISMSKRDIALRGKMLNIDYSKTWSCYKGQEYHCGTCGTCIERKEALQGFDLTQYQGGNEVEI